MKGAFEVFRAALGLGLTSFGGPVAHLGYFRREYVVRRGWLDEAHYADLVALCQALPGPTSSQVGMALGYQRAGVVGALAAWLGFTLPSALVMALWGFLWTLGAGLSGFEGLVHGLGLVAVAVVAQAVWSMGRQLVQGPTAAALALAMAAASALVPLPVVTLVGLALAGCAGLVLFRNEVPLPTSTLPAKGGILAVSCLVVFAVLLAVLPLIKVMAPSVPVALADALYRTGSLVFGGGHVVLPLLQNELVGPGLIDPAAFLAGYGVAQALPGPLFAFSAYLGFLVGGGTGALLALVALFLPSFLLVLGLVPFWERLKGWGWFRRALLGVNAAVVGLLAWAWYDPVFTTAVGGPLDFLVALSLGVGLVVLRCPPWSVVLAGALAGISLQVFGG